MYGHVRVFTCKSEISSPTSKKPQNIGGTSLNFSLSQKVSCTDMSEFLHVRAKSQTRLQKNLKISENNFTEFPSIPKSLVYGHVRVFTYAHYVDVSSRNPSPAFGLVPRPKAGYWKCFSFPRTV